MKKTLILLFVFVGLAGWSNAQKFGHIDSQLLLSMMPERTDAEQKLQQRATDYESALKGMKAEYDQKVMEYQNNPNMPEAVKQTKANQIMQLEQEIQQFQMTAQQDLGEYEATLFSPIIDKAKTAIDAVASANGFTYVFDSSTGATVYNGGEDILALVKKQLGITAETPSAPGE